MLMIWSALMTGSTRPATSAQEVTGIMPPEPSARNAALSMPATRGEILQSALQQGFGVQYWGDSYAAETLARQPHGLLIIEAAKIGPAHNDTGRELLFTPQEIAMISHDGARPVLGYLNISEIEHYRDYWADHADISPPPPWDGPTTGEGEHLAAYWTPDWRDILLRRVDRLMPTGVSGIFLDDVLHYYNFSQDPTLQWSQARPPDAPDHAAELAVAMMELVTSVAERARMWDDKALVIVNNGVFIGRDARGARLAAGGAVFARYLAAIDGILVENLLRTEAHPHVITVLAEDFRDRGVAVLSLDIAAAPEGDAFAASREAVTARSRRNGFFPYLARGPAFNRLAPPISSPSRSPQAPR